MNTAMRTLIGFSMSMAASVALAQSGTGTPSQKPAPAGSSTGAPAAARTPASTPGSGTALRLQTLDATTKADPFLAVDPKNFTADAPSVATVDGYLHSVLGYDANRIWRVIAILKTPAPGVSKVVIQVSERTGNAKVQNAVFFITPDGKHLISDSSGVQPFGAAPFADLRALLQARADGPAHGPASKDLLLVEFADLQCPSCKAAQTTMTRLVQDFPKARIIYQNFPLVDVHPFAFEAATYGVCVAKQSNAAFFTYAQAVYDNQAALTAETGEQTLKDAAKKAGADPAAIAACAATDATKASVNASIALAKQVGIEQTPTLSVNGRLLPIATLPYETLRNLIVFQAGLDGAFASAVSPPGTGIGAAPKP